MMTPREIKGWDLKGILAALGVICAWGLSLAWLLTRDLSTLAVVDLAWILPGIALQTFLYTGLFITAHDAMHGIVTPENPRVNDALGSLAVVLYALFSFKKMRHHHHAHHATPGSVGEDPDFHDGEHPGFFAWYFNFLKNYVSFWQILGMAIVFNVLEHLLGLSAINLLVFWVAPALLSTFQLFYFGTYLPHRGDPGNEHHARSNAYPPWLSFLTCYHFGYHLEHHEYPWCPWWALPDRRSTSNPG